MLTKAEIETRCREHLNEDPTADEDDLLNVVAADFRDKAQPIARSVRLDFDKERAAEKTDDTPKSELLNEGE